MNGHMVMTERQATTDRAQAADSEREVAETNKELMQTLDDAGNVQDWATFMSRHADYTAAYWPGQSEPTRGVGNRRDESVAFFQSSSIASTTGPARAHRGRRLDLLDCAMDGQDDWTDGRSQLRNHPSNTKKSFELESCTVARGRDGKIIEENLFCDQVGLMRQIGVKQ